MDRRLIEEKLESLRRCVARVAEKCPATADRLASDSDLQDIIAMHNYTAIDWGIVHGICQSRLADFRDFAAAVSRLFWGSSQR